MRQSLLTEGPGLGVADSIYNNLDADPFPILATSTRRIYL
jgi:hypothetical protein